MRSLPTSFRHQHFVFSPFWGWLRRVRQSSAMPQLTEKEERAMHAVRNPFSAPLPTWAEQQEVSRGMERWAKLLRWAAHHCFPLLRLLMCFQWNAYPDGRAAVRAFRQLFPSEQQRLLCMSRAAFVATTSRRFRDQGVLFVGAFLPSVQMHAWVVEDGQLVDAGDKIWICYTPIALHG